MKKTIILLIIIFSFSFHTFAEDVEIIYKQENIIDEINLISNDSGTIAYNKRKINVNDLEKFNIKITKVEKNKSIKYLIKKGDISIKYIFSIFNFDGSTNLDVDKIVFSGGDKKFIYNNNKWQNEDEFKNGSESLNFTEISISYDYIKNKNDTYELYLPIYNLLKIFGYDLKTFEEKYGDYDFDRLEIYQPGTFAMWEEESQRKLNKKRTKKFEKIKSDFNFLDQKTLKEIKDKIFNGDKSINRILNYLNNNNVSQKTVTKLFRGEIWFGMTTDQLKAVKGKPNDINTTQTEFYIHEQWVYSTFGREYYYFEDDKLTTIQN